MKDVINGETIPSVQEAFEDYIRNNKDPIVIDIMDNLAVILFYVKEESGIITSSSYKELNNILTLQLSNNLNKIIKIDAIEDKLTRVINILTIIVCNNDTKNILRKSIKVIENIVLENKLDEQLVDMLINNTLDKIEVFKNMSKDVFYILDTVEDGMSDKVIDEIMVKSNILEPEHRNNYVLRNHMTVDYEEFLVEVLHRDKPGEITKIFKIIINGKDYSLEEIEITDNMLKFLSSFRKEKK